MARRRKALAAAALAALGLLGWPAAIAGSEEVELKPEGKPQFRGGQLLAPLVALFRGPDHTYGDRKLKVDTNPPGAVLELFYVRANFQTRSEQADAPVTVVLPSRYPTGGRDTLTVRAMLDGYRMREVSVRLPPREAELIIDLEVLPNTLARVSHRYFAGRSSLSFLTRESLTSRVQEAPEGFSVVLTGTAGSPRAVGTLAQVRSPLIKSAEGQQLGEDLLVRVKLAPAARGDEIELRSREHRDAVRDLYVFTLDLVPADGGASAIARARAALDAIRSEDVRGCVAEFDRGLRAGLDRAELVRALTPHGSFTDPYLRAAMKRLGQLSPQGVISMTDDSIFHPDAPIELAAAMSQGSQARGYLALLRRFVEQLEPRQYRRETLRGLVAPELGAAEFDALMDKAEARERACNLARAQRAPASPAT